MTTFYIIRHGQSEANAKGILQGSQIDTPLTELGRSQAQVTLSKLGTDNFDAIYASPLLRAAQTATIIGGSDKTITFDPRLKEYDYGTWDGEIEADIWQKYPKYFDEHHNLLSNSWVDSKGDTYLEVKSRLESFFDEVIARHPDDSVLVVSHGFTIKLILDYILNIGNLVNIREPTNDGITKVKMTKDTKTVIYFIR